MLPRLEAAVGTLSGLECPEHTGTTCLVGFLTTLPPEPQYLLENAPSIASDSLWVKALRSLLSLSLGLLTSTVPVVPGQGEAGRAGAGEMARSIAAGV